MSIADGGDGVVVAIIDELIGLNEHLVLFALSGPIGLGLPRQLVGHGFGKQMGRLKHKATAEQNS